MQGATEQQTEVSVAVPPGSRARPARVLVTGAGGTPAANFVRSLAAAPEEFRTVGVDADRYCLVRAETDVRLLVPPAADPDYLPVLNSIVTEHDVDLVHVQNDVELGVLSERREELHAPLFLPPKDVVRTCQDKYASYVAWERAGLPVPETRLLHTPDDVRDALAAFGGSAWLRAVSGAAGKGSLPVHDVDTAVRWVDLHRGWGTFTAAELLEPHSVTWMSIWHEGRLVAAQGRRRLYWELGRLTPSGVSGVTGAGVTVNDPLLTEIAQRTILAVDPQPHGLYGVDLTEDRHGRPRPTEINIGRFFTTHHMFTVAGMNMPYIFVKLALGQDPSGGHPAVDGLPAGTVWVRGVDFLPVATTEDAIAGYSRELAERRAAVRSAAEPTPL